MTEESPHHHRDMEEKAGSPRPTAPALHGIVPALVSPLTADMALDVSALEKLMARVVEGGVQGVLLLGTTGEAPSLSLPVKRELIRHGCGLVGDRVAKLVGITTPCLEETLALAHLAADTGADAVLLTAPYYFAIGQSELEAWCRRVVRGSPAPVMLYNMPGNTKVPFEPDTVGRLCDEPGIIGLKDSSGDLAYLARCMEHIRGARPDWSVLVGPERLLVDTLELGGSGCTSAGAMLQPREWAAVYETHRDGRADEARRLQDALLVQIDAIFRTVSGDGYVPRTLKAALALLGIGSGQVAPPLSPCDGDARRRIAGLLEQAGWTRS